MNLKRLLAIAVSAGLLAWLMADGRWRGLGEVIQRLSGPRRAAAFSRLGTVLSDEPSSTITTSHGYG